jgi:hypothetical protein
VFYHDQVTTGFRIHDGSQTTTGSRDVADFARQMRTILDRHLPRVLAGAPRVAAVARASIAVNSALARAASGDPRGLAAACWAVALLGPCGIHRYLRDSRIVERLLPRLRAARGRKL